MGMDTESSIGTLRIFERGMYRRVLWSILVEDKRRFYSHLFLGLAKLRLGLKRS